LNNNEATVDHVPDIHEALTFVSVHEALTVIGPSKNFIVGKSLKGWRRKRVKCQICKEGVINGEACENCNSLGYIEIKIATAYSV
jgi:hypothetical protein